MEALIFGYLGVIVILSLLIISVTYPIFAVYLLPFAFSLSPEIVVGEVLARPITIRLEDLLLTTLLIRIIFEFVISKYLLPPKIYKGEMFLQMFLYSISLIISTSVGVVSLKLSPGSGFFYVLKLIQFFLFYLIFFYYIRNEKDIRIILTGALIAMAVVTVYGFLQIPLVPRISMPFEGEYLEPNTFGGYYILLGSVVAGLYIYEPKGRRKMIYSLLLASAVIPFIYTQSRTSWISAGVSMMTFLFITKGLQRKVVIFALALLTIMSLPLMPEKIKQRAQFWIPEEGFERTEAVGRIKFDPSASERWGQYARKLPELFPKSPILGHGVTGAGFIDGQYLRVLLETGLLGVVTFSFLFYTILRYIYSVYKGTNIPFVRGLAIGLFCATIGLLFHGVGATTFFIVRIVEPYMMFLALLVSYNHIAKRDMEVSTAIPPYIYPYSIMHPIKEKGL